MNSDNVTTPFGRRAVSFGLLAHQFASRKIDAACSIDKWKLFRSICEARPLLGISDRSLAVLNALLSFYPKPELSAEHGLVVFPSNEQLSLRAHGMAEQTLRRHLSALVEAGLILRKDSPNGKRYARKDRAGTISDAYGFSLTPLIARAVEIQQMAEEIIEERLRLQRLREKITLCRRDIFKMGELLETEEQEYEPHSLKSRYTAVISQLDRKTKGPHLSLILEELEEIRLEMSKLLERQINIQKIGGNAPQNERLIQNSESESILEKGMLPAEKIEAVQPVETPDACERVKNSSTEQNTGNQTPAAIVEESYDLQTVLKACPDIEHYGPNGTVRNWHDMKIAANVVKSMLQISQTAYDEAEKTMGIKSAITIIACILQRAENIGSAGGYLRSLTSRRKNNAFSVRPMLSALLKTQLSRNIHTATG